jgi:MFS family permease
MSGILEGAFMMFNDIDKLDTNGMNGFGNAFRSEIKPPTKIVKEFRAGAMNLAWSATSYIFWTIFIVAVVILFCLAYAGTIGWTAAIIISIIVGLLVLLMASLLYNRINDYLKRVDKELRDHVADYTSGMFENLVNAFKSGIMAYAEERTKENQIDPMDSEIYE